MLRRVSFGLLLSSGCMRVPADVSSLRNADAATQATFVEQGASEPIPSGCNGAELSTCADSCLDSACLEWCAGEACAAAIASLWSCMDEAEQRFAAEHLAPQVDYETVTDPDGYSYQQPTGESIDREYEWKAAHESALDERWTSTCEAACSSRLAPTDDGSSFCVDWQSSYHAWARLSEPPPEPSQLGILGTSVSFGMLGTLSLGTSMWLDGELAQRYDDPHTTALGSMITHGSWELDGAESCVPDLDAEGREFAIVVELDANGTVQAAHARDAAADGECIAGVLASAFTLPIRVARDYPQLEVRILVKPMPAGFGGGAWGGLDDGYGGLGLEGSMGDDGNGGLGSVGDGYGTVGSGGGGGGSGYGSGYGGGGAADIAPPPEDIDVDPDQN